MRLFVIFIFSSSLQIAEIYLLQVVDNCTAHHIDAEQPAVVYLQKSYTLFIGIARLRRWHRCIEGNDATAVGMMFKNLR